MTIRRAIPTPQKPFDSYKWRWLHVQPTESLLRPPIFLGVLRALARHEDKAPSSHELADDLLGVQHDTNSPVNLVRTPERNLIRNSGQYWKGTGLLVPETGVVELTPLGRLVASGAVTQNEFAWVMVEETVLPNPVTYSPSEIQKWRDARLEIRPFRLLIQILSHLAENGGLDNAFITVPELIGIVIPLAVVTTPAEITAEALVQYRDGRFNPDGWPDCAPGANDRRLAREFLLFLAHYNICMKTAGDTSDEDRYYLDSAFDIELADEINGTATIEDQSEEMTAQVLESLQQYALPTFSGRERRTSSQLARPGQPKFRRDILAAFGNQCLVTEERLADVLDAAHIVPVEYGGADAVGNGLCLRRDVHRLFDLGHLRISAKGAVMLSNAARNSVSYTHIPNVIELPAFVDFPSMAWRSNYL